MYKNLRQFISALDAAGELVHVGAAVDPVLEVAEITDRLAKSPGGGRALLFEDTGTEFPVLTNMLGSDRRIALALGVGGLDDIAERLDALFARLVSPKEGLAGKLAMLPLLGEMAGWMPKTSAKKGECQQVVLTGERADLTKLPILQCWPGDGGRFVTLPLVHTVDPDTGARNVGMYRMQVTGPRTTGMHWHPYKTGERHYRAYARRGERMPVSVCLGGDPVYTYAATAPVPDNVDEYLLAGFLRRRAVRLVRCVTNGLYVPADCDFVIEGWVDPAQAKFAEGPFGDHTGFYSLEDMYPEFHVTAITHRKDAVWPATLVGIPPQEDMYIAKATERIFLAPIRVALQPEITDMHLPAAGTAHNLALVSIRRDYPGQAFKVAGAMWGAGQMMFNKVLLVAPDGADIRDPDAVAQLVRGVRLPGRVLFSTGVLDVLDHATATPGVGGKIAIDLTDVDGERQVEVPAEPVLPAWASSADMSLAAQWGVGLVRCAPGVAADAEGFLDDNHIRGLNFLVVLDTGTEGLTPAELLWLAAADTDPGRDVRLHGGTMIVDARTKLPGAPGHPARWPNPVAMSADVVARVDARWEEYGLGVRLPSPSVRYRSLVKGEGAEIVVSDK